MRCINEGIGQGCSRRNRLFTRPVCIVKIMNKLGLPYYEREDIALKPRCICLSLFNHYLSNAGFNSFLGGEGDIEGSPDFAPQFFQFLSFLTYRQPLSFIWREPILKIEVNPSVKVVNQARKQPGPRLASRWLLMNSRTLRSVWQG